MVGVTYTGGVMERLSKKYSLLVEISIVEGCFSSVEDVMKYIQYRLNLRSKETDNIRMHSISVLKEEVYNDQVEMKL